MPEPDDILIQQFLAGNQNAFTQIVNRHKRIIFQFVFAKVADLELAADLTQEVFVKLFKSANQYKMMGRFRSWLFKIAHNICIDAHRKQSGATILSLNASEHNDENSFEFLDEIADSVSDPSKELEYKETKSIIDQALTSLSEKHRTAFILCQFQGMSYPEIAEIQKCPLGTVKSRIHTALARIRDYLKENDLLE